MKTLSLKKAKNVSYITAFIYTALIGAGVFTSYHFFGVAYTDLGIVNTLIWFEIVMTIFAVVMAFKYFSPKELGFTKINMKNIIWLVPMALVGGILLFNVANFVITNHEIITPEQWKMFGVVALMTFLVGFSEELVYRGVVFAAFLKKSKVAALLVSGVIFSLLHAVNIFGGLDLVAMLAQLGLTFLGGLFFGIVRLKIESIIPLILFHFAWDFILFSGQVFNTDINGDITTYMLVFEFVVVILFVPYFVWTEMKMKKKKNNTLKK